jgi:hypothetical protein
MKRVVVVALLALTLSTAAYANTIDFLNQGGTISGSASGLTLSSTIMAVVGLSGFTSGTLSLMTGAMMPGGSLASGGTFGPGSLTITSNVFNGTFLFNSATWSLESGTFMGNHVYDLTLFFANDNGHSGQFAIVAGGGVFVNMADVESGDTVVATVVPEPATLGLLGTGLVAVGGLVRRKLKCG